jgi:hypothetical protein
MRITKDAPGIRKEFEAGQQYKTAIGLYDTYAQNEDFYIGNQWRGVDADDLDKPVINFLRRVVSMHIAKVGSTDWSVRFKAFVDDEQNDSISRMLSDQVDQVIERLGLKAIARAAQRNECVDGDACVYFGFDADAESGMDVPGMVTAELLENINVYFGNRYSRDVQSQPYIILHKRMFLGDVKDEAKKNGVSEDDIASIHGDSDDHQMEADSPSDLVTVLIKMWKENGTVHCMKTVQDVVLQKDTDTGYKLYPVAWSSWEIVKSSYHGQAMLTGLIPNQIALNKSWAGVIWQIQKTGFSQPVVDRTRIPEWDGSPGQVIEAKGPVANVRDAVMYLEAAPVPVAVINAMDSLMSTTRDCMGASDATMGDVNPDNASAIIALQQADEQPLELRKQAFHDFVESMCRIIADIIRARYGERQVMMNGPVLDKNGQPVLDENGQPQQDVQLQEFDFSTLDELQMTMRVDVGASSLYSEQLQVQTASNLFTTGIIDDPAKLAIYLKIMPEKYIPSRQILQQYCENLLKQTMQAMAPQQTGEFNPAMAQDDVNVTPVQPRVENTMNAQP